MDMARRSSRANRASQPQSTLQHSSVSTAPPNRPDRATRSSNKAESPEKLNAISSLSSEPLDEIIATVEDTTAMQTRRKRGRVEETKDRPVRSQTSQASHANGADEVCEDDEAVRCICGLDDYPGPPQLEEDVKSGTRELIDDPLIPVAEVTEDLAGFFLQCDICKVWQHGGCVGIMNESTSPEEYFCERCRKDLHKIFISPHGQRYSNYLPLYQSLTRLSSRTASFSKDRTRSPRDSKSGRNSSSNQNANAKKRSTMNSRDAAYDEEEQLRRAIKASKDDKSGEGADGGTRRVKRGQSDGEERSDYTKRQRTESASPSSRDLQVSIQTEPEDCSSGRTAVGRRNKGPGPKNSKEKESKDEREKSRYGAGNNRSGRAERKRADDSDPLEDQPLTHVVLVNNSNETNNATNYIPTSESAFTSISTQSLDNITLQVTSPDTFHLNPVPTYPKRGGRPPYSRKGKLGKNQYTRDRELQDHNDQASHRSQSRDTSKNDDNVHAISNRGFNGEGRTSKFKGNHSKVTMTDMKKRASAILDFISRTQLEMASESIPQATGDTANLLIHGLAAGLPSMLQSKNSNQEVVGENSNVEKEFKDLSCRDMMDVLTKKLIKWQKEFL